jgi:hypothetical protein
MNAAATLERSEWAQNLFPRNNPKNSSSNISKFLKDASYREIETEKRGANLKIAHKTATHPVFEKLFNDVIPVEFRDMANTGVDKLSRFNEFIAAWGTTNHYITDSENIEDNDWPPGRPVELPIIIIDKIPSARVKHAEGNGDCSIHTMFTSMFSNFRKLTQDGKVELVEISKTNILPWMLFKIKGLFGDPLVRREYPVKYEAVSQPWDIHKSIKDIRVPGKYLSDQDITAIIRLFNVCAFIWNPAYTNEGYTTEASLLEIGASSDEAYLFFSKAPSHYMPVSNGATWKFSTDALRCIASFIVADESSSSCKYKNREKVLYKGELYYVVDRLASDAINTGSGEKSGSEVGIVIEYIQKGLQVFSKTKKIKGNYSQTQKDEFREMCIKKAIKTARPPCVGYILLKHIEEGEQGTKTTDGMIKAAVQYSDYAIPEGHKTKESRNPYKDGGKSLPKMIDRYNVELVVVTNEDDIKSAEDAAAAPAVAQCMEDSCREYYAEVQRLLDVYGVKPGANAAGASSSDTENDEANEAELEALQQEIKRLEAKRAARIAPARRPVSRAPARRTVSRAAKVNNNSLLQQAIAASLENQVRPSGPSNNNNSLLQQAIAASLENQGKSAAVPAKPAIKEENIQKFINITGRNRKEAEFYLEASNGNVNKAIESSFGGGSRKKTVNRKNYRKNRMTRKQ